MPKTSNNSILNVEKDELKEIKNPVVATPEFVTQIHQDFLAQSAHCFIVSGNVFDYMDPQGARMFILDVLGSQFDTCVKKNNAEFAKRLGYHLEVKDQTNQVLAFFESGRGLAFLTQASEKEFQDFMTSAYPEDERMQNGIMLAPQTFGDTMDTLNWYFKAARGRMLRNSASREAGCAKDELEKELNFTIVFIDAPFLVPAGDIGHMDADRRYLAMVRSWSRDLELGNRNKIIFVTSSLAEVNDTIRSSDAWVKHITIKKPNLEQRRTWLNHYNENLQEQAKAKHPQRINGRNWTEINLAPSESLDDIAIQAAGMNFKQMEGPVVATAIAGTPLTVNIIKKAKQAILESEYGGMLEFLEPQYGFENIGGHEHLKRYFRERIINPVRKRQKDVCSDGVILAGPGGTGKTEIASSLAYESNFTFLVGHLDKLKDKYVGNSEKMMSKFLDGVRAAAPCILFLDEFDSVFGTHARQGAGDGGVQNGQFNSFMQFASDPTRRGEIILIAATNRPDLLDPALIRPGRFSDILPALPPKPEDWAGKMAILFAIMNRKGVKFSTDLRFDDQVGPETQNPLSLLARDKRFWTGAEINKIVEDMILNAQLAEDDRKQAAKAAGQRYQFRITADDVSVAFRNVIPKTGKVKEMIALSLEYMNNRRYVPVGWEKDLEDAEATKEKKETAPRTAAANFDRE